MKTLLTAAIALSIVASAGAASAQPGPQRQDQHPQQSHDDHGRPGDNNDRRQAPKRFKANRYQAPKGYQASHQWRRGEKLPSTYRGRGYVVDYRPYGLSAPPRGYQYVRVGNDVVLTAIATGVISSVIVSLFQ